MFSLDYKSDTCCHWGKPSEITEKVFFRVMKKFFFFWPSSLQDLSSLTRDWTWNPAVKVLSSNHWTAREFPWKNIFISYLISKIHMTTFPLDSQPVSSWKTRVFYSLLIFFPQHFEEYILKDQNSIIGTILMISFKNWIKIKVHIVYRQLCSGNNALWEIIFKCQLFN